jgi:hypothetical protein
VTATGGHLDHLHRAALHVGHQRAEPGQVVDVLHALAHRLEGDRELLVAPGHGEELGRLLPLLPQRRAAPRIPPGEQQGAGRALAEPRGVQRRPTQLGDHDLLDLGRVEQHVLGRRHDLGPGVVQRVGQPQHDAVVGGGRVALHPAALPHPRRDRERPRPVDLRAERGVHDEAPVAQLVAEALDEDHPVAGHVPGGLALLAQVGEQVVGGPLVETRAHGPFAGVLLRQPAISRTKAPTARPSSSGRPTCSPFQNGSRAGTPGAGVTITRSCVMSSTRQLDVPSMIASPTRDS